MPETMSCQFYLKEELMNRLCIAVLVVVQVLSAEAQYTNLYSFSGSDGAAPRGSPVILYSASICGLTARGGTSNKAAFPNEHDRWSSIRQP